MYYQQVDCRHHWPAEWPCRLQRATQINTAICSVTISSPFGVIRCASIGSNRPEVRFIRQGKFIVTLQNRLDENSFNNLDAQCDLCKCSLLPCDPSSYCRDDPVCRYSFLLCFPCASSNVSMISGKYCFTFQIFQSISQPCCLERNSKVGEDLIASVGLIQYDNIRLAFDAMADVL